MTSQSGQQIITIYTLPSISRCKGNQTIKFDQLIEYKMRNIFLEKSNTKCCGEATTRPFYKSLDQQSEMLKSLFLFYVQVEVYQDILKLKC